MSLKEIRLIRLLIWVLLYLVVLFLLIFLVVIPVVKSYKSANTLYVEKKARYLAAKEENDAVFERLKSLQAKNRKVIEAFENRWDEKRFVSLARRHFLKLELKPVDLNTSEKYFRVYEINAMVKMDTPQKFYQFLEALPGMGYVIQADFPIAFRAHGGDEIEGIFRIRVYEENPASSESNRSSAPVSKR